MIQYSRIWMIFNLKFMLPKLPRPRLYLCSSYTRYGKFMMRRQARFWIIIHSSTTKELVIIYLTNYQLRSFYRRIKSHFWTNTFFYTPKGNPTSANACAHIFMSEKRIAAVYPMCNKSDFQDSLQMFCKDIGVSISLVVDPSGGKLPIRSESYIIKSELQFGYWKNRTSGQIYLNFISEFQVIYQEIY